jgi:predicted Zn-dependent protease
VSHASAAESLEALVRYSCYQRVLNMVRSCHRLSETPDRQEAYERVEQAVLHLMDQEWPGLVHSTEYAVPAERLSA